MKSEFEQGEVSALVVVDKTIYGDSADITASVKYTRVGEVINMSWGLVNNRPAFSLARHLPFKTN
jgi:hypothetical protein